MFFLVVFHYQKNIDKIWRSEKLWETWCFLHEISWFPKDQSIGLGGLGEKEIQAFISEYGQVLRGITLSNSGI